METIDSYEFSVLDLVDAFTNGLTDATAIGIFHSWRDKDICEIGEIVTREIIQPHFQDIIDCHNASDTPDSAAIKSHDITSEL